VVQGCSGAEGSVGQAQYFGAVFGAGSAGCSATAAGADPEQIDVYPVHKHRPGTHVATQAAVVPADYQT
jgi:hypothetical protein